MNNQIPELTEQDLNNLSSEIQNPNQNLFKEIIQAANLPEEKVKKEIPNLEKPGKNDRIEPIKTKTDQEKIDAYDNLEEKGLPEKKLPITWKADLARLKYLEGELSNYNKVKEELKTWTDIFGEKKPTEIQGEIKKLEEEKQEKEKELGGKISDLEKSLEVSNSENKEVINKLKEESKELEEKIKDWNIFFKGKDLSEVKEEWEGLQKRPDLAVSENEFYDDYARRKSLRQSELEKEDLERERKLVEETQEQNKELRWIINEFLKATIIRRYIMAKPVSTVREAQEAIAELLEEEERRLSNYFENGEKLLSQFPQSFKSEEVFEKVDQTHVLLLSLWQKDKKNQAHQVLEWIREAKNDLDYEKLFENWSGGKEYNEKNDFDGTLAILKRLLEIQDLEPAL